MRLLLDLQVAAVGVVPGRTAFVRWGRAAFAGMGGSVRLGIRIVDEVEATDLNTRYRQRSGPTNVLSFPYEDTGHGAVRLLGDLVICAPVVRAEARAAGRLEQAHWAHMVVHGIMHLRGFDHINDQDAAVMEGWESTVLTGLGFADPYC
ncbi:MAG: rRNA maturation RNase YbeY [Acidiferrobacter sp.]